MMPDWLTLSVYVALALGSIGALVILLDILSGHHQSMAVMIFSEHLEHQ